MKQFIVFLIGILILIIFGSAIISALDRRKIKKKDIASWYGVSKPTLNKWVKHLCPSVSYEQWNSPKLRIVKSGMILKIVSKLGWPEPEECLTKKQILEKCYTHYHTVRQNVHLNYDKIGLTPTSYSSMDVFPPKVSSRIVKTLGE